MEQTDQGLLGQLPEARWKWAGNGERPYEDAYSARQMLELLVEIERLRAEVGRITDAGRAHIRRADEFERERERHASRLRLAADRVDDIADHAEPDVRFSLRTLAAELRA